MTLDEAIYKAMIAHQTDLLRVEAGLQQDVRKAFRQLAKEMADMLRDIDPTGPVRPSARLARLEKLIGNGSKEISKAIRQIMRDLGKDLSQLVAVEQAAVVQTINEAVGFGLANKTLTKDMLEKIAGNILIQGGTLVEWGAGLTKTVQQQLASELRMGLLAGENLNELLRRVGGRRENGFKDGIIPRASKQAEKIVRTAVAEVNGAARLAVLQRNSDVASALEWSSTLDNVTSDICIGLDGQRWDIKTLKPVDGSESFPGAPPAHWNCRSSLVPVMKSLGELSRNPRIREKLKDSRFTSPERASAQGPVPGKWKYEDWLKSRPKDEQMDILGPTKYELWKSGKLKSLRDLTDQHHRPLTVAQLKEKYGA